MSSSTEKLSFSLTSPFSAPSSPLNFRKTGAPQTGNSTMPQVKTAQWETTPDLLSLSIVMSAKIAASSTLPSHAPIFANSFPKTFVSRFPSFSSSICTSSMTWDSASLNCTFCLTSLEFAQNDCCARQSHPQKSPFEVSPLSCAHPYIPAIPQDALSL